MVEDRKLRVLLVDDDETFRRVYGNALGEDGFAVEAAADGVAALEVMNRRSFDLVLVDLRMPRMDGLSLLGELRRRHPAAVPLVLTGFGSVPSAVEAMRHGAFDVLSKSAPPDHVVATLRRAAAERARSRAGTALEDEAFANEAFFGLVGRSPAMRDVFRSIERFQEATEPVLVTGESGTGKELVARALHAGGPRRNGPLIVVNCGSLRENFVENELFGHARGAFTGAAQAKPGLYALADGGTLHIDEVGELPEGAQAALLRVLETGRFRPLGALDEVGASVRVIASTNKDLARMVADRNFRADLFYRLCVCRIDLPPLRVRREDIPLLVNHFLDRSANARRLGARIGRAALDALVAHDWAGNVRELFNTLERAVLLAGGEEVRLEHLGPLSHGLLPAESRRPPPPSGGEDADPTLEEFERRYVKSLLERTGYNVSAVARILAVDPTTVRRKLRRWGVGD